MKPVALGAAVGPVQRDGPHRPHLYPGTAGRTWPYLAVPVNEQVKTGKRVSPTHTAQVRPAGRPPPASPRPYLTCAFSHHRKDTNTMKDLPPLRPETFDGNMRQVVLWHLLINEADDFTRRNGFGLALLWTDIRRGDYDAARARMDRWLYIDALVQREI